MSNEDFIEEIEQNIEEHGVQIIQIDPDNEKDSPSFTYTIGLTATGRPEILVFSLPEKAAHIMLNDLAILENKDYFQHKLLTEIGNLPMIVKPVADNAAVVEEYVCWAGNLYDDVADDQLIWPDEEGKFPWKDGWNKSFDPYQSALYSLS